MKRTLYAIFVLLLLASCESDGYTVKGSFPAAEDGTVVYMTATDEYYTTVDSAIIKNGSFEFSGGYFDRTLRMLLVPSKAMGGPVVLENGVINVKFGNTIERSGTEGNFILQRFVEAGEHLRGLETATSPAFLKAMPMDKVVYDSLVTAREQARASLVAYAYFAVEKNIDNSLGFYILTKSYTMLDANLVAPLLEQVPQYMQNARYKVVKDFVSARIESERRKGATAVGKNYLNFELPDINGKKVLFSSVVEKNKYTLLQFWASWCAPCRVELPEVNKVYNKFGKKGFAAVGVSLDSDPAEWSKAVAKLSLSWPQLCQPSGGSAEVAAAYGVDAVPSNLLINNKGTIIARDISVAELESLLGENLK